MRRWKREERGDVEEKKKKKKKKIFIAGIEIVLSKRMRKNVPANDADVEAIAAIEGTTTATKMPDRLPTNRIIGTVLHHPLAVRTVTSATATVIGTNLTTMIDAATEVLTLGIPDEAVAVAMMTMLVVLHDVEAVATRVPPSQSDLVARPVPRLTTTRSVQSSALSSRLDSVSVTSESSSRITLVKAPFRMSVLLWTASLTEARLLDTSSLRLANLCPKPSNFPARFSSASPSLSSAPTLHATVLPTPGLVTHLPAMA
jgi:hypothetical protein